MNVYEPCFQGEHLVPALPPRSARRRAFDKLLRRSPGPPVHQVACLHAFQGRCHAAVAVI